MLYSINKYSSLSHEYLNLYVSDYDIYAYYLNRNFKIGQPFNSPFHEDKNPSFGIYDVGNGKLLFKDFSKGFDGNAITFVQKLLKLPDFKSALIQIYIDLIIQKKKIQLKDIKINTTYKNRKVDIGVKRQPFSKKDLEWWKKFGISKDVLEMFEVSAIKYMLYGPYVKHEYTEEEPMYVYKVYDKLKIYRPLSDKSQKWYGSLTRNYIHGYKQLTDEADLLIITKSLKDTMCLYSLGYNAISPSSEGTLIPEHIIRKLRKRFKNIVIFYDNDEPGRAYAKRISDRYNLPYTYIPLKYKEKDTSDFYKKYGEENTKKLLKNLFNSYLVSDKYISDEKESKEEEKQ